MSRTGSRFFSTLAGGFTLLELLGVLTLMTLTVGLVAFRMDGLTEAGRLRSTAAQIEAVLRLARGEAQISGTPRQLVLALDQDRLLLRRPCLEQDAWNWDEGATFQTAGGVRLHRAVFEGGESATGQGAATLTIDGRGGFRATALVLRLHDGFVVWVARPHEEARLLFKDAPPESTSWNALEQELERGHAAP